MNYLKYDVTSATQKLMFFIVYVRHFDNVTCRKREAGNDNLCALNMVMDSVCSEPVNQARNISSQLRISTELVLDNHKEGKTITIQGKCILSACESVYPDILVPRCETARLR